MFRGVNYSGIILLAELQELEHHLDRFCDILRLCSHRASNLLALLRSDELAKHAINSLPLHPFLPTRHFS